MNDAVAPGSDFEREKWKNWHDLEHEKWTSQREFEREKWQTQHEFERQKWQAESANRDRDISLRGQELKLRKEEIVLRGEESHRARWANPLLLAILGATVAGIANVGVNALNNRYQLSLESQKSEATIALERSKAEATRILEMIKTGDWKKGSENLRFLVESGLISDPLLAEKITTFVRDNKSGPGPSLPPSVSSSVPPSISIATPDPDTLLVCDRNPSTGRYDLNCHPVSRKVENAPPVP
jgi:hypothetical protein